MLGICLSSFSSYLIWEHIYRYYYLYTNKNFRVINRVLEKCIKDVSVLLHNGLNEYRWIFPSLKVNPVEQKKIIQVNEMKFFTGDLIMTCCYQPAATGFTDPKSVMFLVVPGKENLDIDWDLPHVDNTWSVLIIIYIVNLFVEREKCFARSRLGKVYKK